MKRIQTKRSPLQRQRRRNAGLAMMEYVILGTVIAAAVLVAAIFFGDAIRTQFNTMTHAVAGQPAEAVQSVTAARALADDTAGKSEEHRDGIVNYDGGGGGE